MRLSDLHRACRRLHGAFCGGHTRNRFRESPLRGIGNGPTFGTELYGSAAGASLTAGCTIVVELETQQKQVLDVLRQAEPQDGWS